MSLRLTKDDSFSKLSRKAQHRIAHLLDALAAFGPKAASEVRWLFGNTGIGLRLQRELARRTIEVLHEHITGDAEEKRTDFPLLASYFFGWRISVMKSPAQFLSSPGASGHAKGVAMSDA